MLGLDSHTSNLFRGKDLITRKFYLVVTLFVLIVLCLMGLDRFQVKIIDAARSYVAGEGFWSKGQKDAAFHLEHYGVSFDAQHYELFLKGLAPSLGDRQARLALLSQPPDIEKAREGFQIGRNHSEDIDGMIFLFLYFNKLSYMQKAISYWTEGDALIDKLILLGKAVDAEVKSPTPDKQVILDLLVQVDQLNSDISKVEDNFSATLGDASRWVSDLTLKLMSLVAIMLLAIGTILALQIVRGIRHTQATLEMSEARFRHVVDSNMIGIIFWQADGTISEANDLFLQTIGYSREDLDNRRLDWVQLTPQEYEASDQVALEEVIRTGSCAPFEKEFIHKDGHRVPVLLGAASFEDSNTSGVCFVIDNSERKQAEQALRQAATVFQGANEAIMVVDANSAITMVNPAFEQITGYSHAEVIGRNPNLLKSGKHENSFFRKLWRQLQGEGIWKGEIINRRKSGELFHAWLSITAIPDNDGSVAEYVAVFSDMTEIRSMEEQFHHAQKMEAIGTLVAGIAHDFNNTLAAMKGYVFMAQFHGERNELEKSMDKLGLIDGLIDQSADMVRQLMTFARKDVVQLKPLFLNELLYTHERMISSFLPEDVQLTFNVCQGSLWIRGDETQLQQVLLNLLNNAHDAVADREHPAISISLSWVAVGEALLTRFPDMDAEQVAHIQVCDNGIGMNEEELEHVYDPFYTTKEVGKGTGLGMSMVYGSVKSHGGYIDIDSARGEGTCIHVYLPVVEKVDAPEMPVHSSGHLVEVGAKTILLVDDNPRVRGVYVEALKAFGYQVLCAEDGLAAKEAFEERGEQIDIIITDIVMPKLGGFKFVDHVRIHRPELPVIFITGYDPQQAQVPQQLQERSLILRKPFDIMVLKNHVWTLLEQS